MSCRNDEAAKQSPRAINTLPTATPTPGPCWEQERGCSPGTQLPLLDTQPDGCLASLARWLLRLSASHGCLVTSLQCVCVRASAAVDRVLVFGLPLDCATARKTDLPCSRLWPALLVPHHLLLPLSLSLAPTFIPWLPKKFPVATSAHGACGCWQCFCSLGKHSAWKIVQLHLLHFSHLPLFLPSLVSFVGAV